MSRGITVSKGPYSGRPPARPDRGRRVTRTIGLAFIGLIVAATLYFMLDLGSRLWAESYVAGQVQKSLQMTARPSVSFGGTLFLPELFGGKLSSAEVKATSFEAQGVGFVEVDLHLQDVSFSPLKLVLHKPSTITAHAGSGEASMTDVQLTKAFQDQGVPIVVRFDPEGNVRVASARLPVSVTVTVQAAIEEGRLVLRPTRFKNISFAVSLPQLVPGMTYRSVAFDDRLGTLRFTLNDATFAVGQPSG